MLATRRSVKILVGLFVCLLPGLFFAFHPTEANIKASTFGRLTSIRNDRKQQLVDYFNNIRRTAGAIRQDDFMQACFHRLSNRAGGSDTLVFAIDRHFVNRYGDFYDILFVDATGYVFHSIRKESDYHSNLFAGELAGTKLVNKLRRSATERFVEYEFYPPSREPAAFFAVPVVADDRQAGWFVLQCAVNRVNTILTTRKGLGRTGEVYLVNRDRLMLSDSRFIEDSTILKHRVETRAVREALRNNIGQRLIEDYRGIRVFSAFEKFDLFGTTWIIIAEIDESEVLTAHFRSDPEYYLDKMQKQLAAARPAPPGPRPVGANAQRVDMNEYAKAEARDALQTFGVSSCTAVAITLPERFAYLAHISPRDMIYRAGPWSFLFEAPEGSDFLGELIRRIKHYDVYPYEWKQVEVVVTATHTNGLANAVAKVLDSGLDLGNIRFLYNPHARGANLLVRPQGGQVFVQWYGDTVSTLSSNIETRTLEDLHKEIIGYDA